MCGEQQFAAPKNISIIYNRIRNLMFSFLLNQPHIQTDPLMCCIWYCLRIFAMKPSMLHFLFVQMPTHFRPYHSVLLILILAFIGWINGFRRAYFKCMRSTNLRLRVQSGFFYFHLIMTMTFAKRMDGCYPCKQTSTPPSPQPIRLGKRLFFYRPIHFFTFFIFFTQRKCVLCFWFNVHNILQLICSYFMYDFSCAEHWLWLLLKYLHL